MKAKSDIFGRLLQLSRVTVNLIHRQYSDPQDRLLQVIDEFLQQNQDPTWRVITNALKHPLLNYHELAENIEMKYGGYNYRIFVLMGLTQLILIRARHVDIR